MSGRISRRAFNRGLVWTAGAIGAGAAGMAAVRAQDLGDLGNIDPARPLLFASPELEPFVDPLPRLPVLTGSQLELRAASTTHRFHRDLAPSPALAYGGMDYLGPTVEAHAGDAMTVAYRNEIGVHPLAADFDTTLHGVTEQDRTSVPTSMHLHGAVTPPEHDGHPAFLQRPGQGHVHHYPNGHEATQLWYHDHAMGITRLNVYAGLAGMFLLRDEFDTGTTSNAWGLPSGEFELPLVLQEKIFTADGRQSIRATPVVPQGRWDGGTPGDVGVVNGKIWPELEVARGMYRLRLVNAASFSVWNLFFGNRMRFWVLGMESGMLAAPVPTTRIRLAPGERADLLVDFGAVEPGGIVELCNDEPPPLAASQRGARAMPLFCRFRMADGRGFTAAVPETLRGGAGQPSDLEPVPAPQVQRTVTVMQLPDPSTGSVLMSLNNLRFGDADIEMPRQGAVEQWDIVNVTPEPHPIHLHLVNFRVLGRQDFDVARYTREYPAPPVGTKWAPPVDAFVTGPLIPPEPWEAGPKDTVVANPGTVTRIVAVFPTAGRLGFDPDATFGVGELAAPVPPQHGGHGTPAHAGHDAAPAASGPLQGYVWHCHMLDHEDHDMMLGFRTVAE
ncbi:multicopper oxidase domain-containing protein [Rhodococcus hoagii]|uniref:Tat pathway signal sequence domain protein n=1 Tax=Prescottella equi ATCC 33707 TaxID=525370 RepID=E9SX91_RHOHA|nr:multicopper oxidase domain-containing protein [Prescottella equi]EGD25528.1 Tat pathway signal sequence domain protein [Prescottella equi ATCC 33707]MBM4518199.1 multicopper oxidase domain-containing protein [Prescottella equi]MBM4527616.1 multicopper oxidase domain-containing protein [Prescottella equi]MBM4546686.1 multicopper oxidase domain-containing protein [Prescottella equi]MBM4573507.1 multicopper oxidase domain-containing protein [Prescottella equi]